MPDQQDQAKKPRRNPILSAEIITVPADAAEKRCTSCDLLCYWGETKNGKRTLVDCRFNEQRPDANLYPPTPAVPSREIPGRPGRGISHFYTCPNAHQHSRPKV